MLNPPLSGPQALPGGMSREEFIVRSATCGKYAGSARAPRCYTPGPFPRDPPLRITTPPRDSTPGRRIPGPASRCRPLHGHRSALSVIINLIAGDELRRRQLNNRRRPKVPAPDLPASAKPSTANRDRLEFHVARRRATTEPRQQPSSSTTIATPAGSPPGWACACEPMLNTPDMTLPSLTPLLLVAAAAFLQRTDATALGTSVLRLREQRSRRLAELATTTLAGS